MVLEQNQAEKQKKESQELKIILDERNLEVAQQKEIAEQDLAKAEPALKEAQKAVSGIKKKHLDEIRALARPPAAIRLTMEAVIMMLNPEKIKGRRSCVWGGELLWCGVFWFFVCFCVIACVLGDCVICVVCVIVFLCSCVSVFL